MQGIRAEFGMSRGESVVFCWCGCIIANNQCPTHHDKWLNFKVWKAKQNPKKGKWSGPTKRMKGAYEDY
ncbi:MAG: hypothetical protein CMI54_03520 [Parcubacteria group bacterium]|jgi:hypothetical protein|nr:hypothetical protein [Parcubacteria group bacterium]|tara:strand:- start:4158 stop:4364 length:207 start_codon:yes stop_codon:yes gene_type:complete